MKELDMIKAFAELEGINVVISACECFVCYSSGNGFIEYNPITDLALNCAARDKYRVEIDYEKLNVFIFKALTQVCVTYHKDFDLNKAVIHCILKSNDLCI